LASELNQRIHQNLAIGKKMTCVEPAVRAGKNFNVFGKCFILCVYKSKSICTDIFGSLGEKS